MVFALPGQVRDELPPPEGAYAINGRTQFRVPVGPTYDYIFLTFTVGGVGLTAAQIAADIDQITVRIGPQVKLQVTGPELVYLMDRRIPGIVSPGNNGVLPLLFSRPEMQPVSAVRQGGQLEPNFSNIDGPAYGTIGESTFTIEIEWAAVINGDTLAGHAVTRAGTPLGQHITILPHLGNLAGAGTDEITDIKLNRANSFVALHFVDANITNLEIRADNQPVVQCTSAVLQSDEQLNGFGIDPNFLTANFVPRGRFADALSQTMNSLRVRPTFSVGPGTYRVLLEQVETAVVRNIAANTGGA